MSHAISENIPPDTKREGDRLLDLRARPLAAWLVFAVLGAATPLVLVMELEGSFSFPFILACLVTLYASLRLSWLALFGRQKLIRLTLWVFVYTFLGVVSMMETWIGAFPAPDTFTSDGAALALCMVLVGLVCMDVGAFIGERLPAAPRDSQPGEYGVDISRLYLFSLFVTVMSLALIQLRGGLIAAVSPRGMLLGDASFVVEQQAGSLILNALYQKPPAAALMAALWVWVRRRDLLQGKRAVAIHTAVVLFLAFFNLIANNPLNCPRLWTGSLLVCAVFMLVPWRRCSSMAFWGLSFSLGLLLLFSPLDPRDVISRALAAEQGIQVNMGAIIAEAPWTIATSGDFDALKMIDAAIAYTEEQGFAWGRQLLGYALFWVPRSLWPDKPIGTGAMIGESVGWYHTNVSAPLWAEGYVNFGLPGVMLFLFVYGLIVGRLEWAFRQGGSLRRRFLVGVAVPLLAGNNFIFLRGDMGVGTQHALPFLVFLCLCVLYVVRRRSPLSYQAGMGNGDIP